MLFYTNLKNGYETIVSSIEDNDTKTLVNEFIATGFNQLVIDINAAADDDAAADIASGSLEHLAPFLIVFAPNLSNLF